MPQKHQLEKATELIAWLNGAMVNTYGCSYVQWSTLVGALMCTENFQESFRVYLVQNLH